MIVSLRRRLHSIILSGLFVLLYACGQPAPTLAVKPLRIAVAANMQFALEEVVQTLTTKTGIPVELIISSSGKLKAQIQEGAPYDLFISADTLYPQRLYASGIGQQAPRIYAYGKLVFWTMHHDIPLHLDSLHLNTITHIAIANPKIAPYGRAAQEVLQQLTHSQNIWPKVVQAESISQTNQFVLSGAAEVGLTALAAVRSLRLRTQGHWVPIDTTIHAPIAQAALLLQDTPAAQSAYDFLFSATARAILSRYGYSLP